MTHFEGASLVETKYNLPGAYALVSVITGPRGYDEERDLIRHEYGHYLQSQMHGLSYLYRIAIPSLYSYIRSYLDKDWIHEEFWTEIEAQELSDIYFKKRNNYNNKIDKKDEIEDDLFHRWR